MILSLFLRGKEFFISTESFSEVYTVLETRELADNIVDFLSVFLKKQSNQEIEKVVFSSGPGSFTSVRVLNSIVRGLYVAYPKIDFTSVSSFLPYFYSIYRTNSEGIIAVPTMRGDFFVSKFINQTLLETKVCSSEEINKYGCKIYYDNDEAFNCLNLAKLQIELLNSNIAEFNSSLISNSLDVDYGYCPEFKH